MVSPFKEWLTAWKRVKPPKSALNGPLFAGALLICVGIAGSACTTSRMARPAAPESAYLVSARKSAFYKYGPAQGSGPDFNLVKDQRVTMVKRGFGFSEIRTTDGEKGYMATDDLLPAPPEEPPPPLPPPVPARKRATVSQQTRDLPQVNDLPLPGRSSNRGESDTTPDLTADPF